MTTDSSSFSFSAMDRFPNRIELSQIPLCCVAVHDLYSFSSYPSLDYLPLIPDNVPPNHFGMKKYVLVKGTCPVQDPTMLDSNRHLPFGSLVRFHFRLYTTRGRLLRSFWEKNTTTAHIQIRLGTYSYQPGWHEALRTFELGEDSFVEMGQAWGWGAGCKTLHAGRVETVGEGIIWVRLRVLDVELPWDRKLQIWRNRGGLQEEVQQIFLLARQEMIRQKWSTALKRFNACINTATATAPPRITTTHRLSQQQQQPYGASTLLRRVDAARLAARRYKLVTLFTKRDHQALEVAATDLLTDLDHLYTGHKIWKNNHITTNMEGVLIDKQNIPSSSSSSSSETPFCNSPFCLPYLCGKIDLDAFEVIPPFPEPPFSYDCGEPLPLLLPLVVCYIRLYAVAHFYLAIGLAAHCKFRDACKAFKTAYKIDPNTPDLLRHWREAADRTVYTSEKTFRDNLRVGFNAKHFSGKTPIVSPFKNALLGRPKEEKQPFTTSQLSFHAETKTMSEKCSTMLLKPLTPEIVQDQMLEEERLILGEKNNQPNSEIEPLTTSSSSRLIAQLAPDEVSSAFSSSDEELEQIENLNNQIKQKSGGRRLPLSKVCEHQKTVWR